MYRCLKEEAQERCVWLDLVLTGLNQLPAQEWRLQAILRGTALTRKRHACALPFLSDGLRDRPAKVGSRKSLG